MFKLVMYTSPLLPIVESFEDKERSLYPLS